MSERAIDVVRNLVHGQKRDGRCIYERRAKQELVRRCQQPGAADGDRLPVAPLVISLPAGTHVWLAAGDTNSTQPTFQPNTCVRSVPQAAQM